MNNAAEHQHEDARDEKYLHLEKLKNKEWGYPQAGACHKAIQRRRLMTVLLIADDPLENIPGDLFLVGFIGDERKVFGLVHKPALEDHGRRITGEAV
jgi:hypothetical protein